MTRAEAAVRLHDLRETLRWCAWEIQPNVAHGQRPVSEDVERAVRDVCEAIERLAGHVEGGA